MTTPAQQPTEFDIREDLAGGRRREAFERLLGLYRQKVFHLAFSMLRDPTQAEDLAQDIFLRVWKGLPGYTGQASLSTWIYTISRNACLTELKRRAARPTVSLNDPTLEPALEEIAQTLDPERGAELDVQELLGELPEKYRRVVVLFYLEERSYEEVAAILGVPLGTVKTFLFRAKRELLKIGRRQPVLLPA